MSIRKLLFLGIIPVLLGLGPASAQEKVGQGVIEVLQAKGKAFVVIALVEPPSINKPKIDLQTVKNEIANLQEGVLSQLDASDFSLKHKYSSVPALAGTVTETGIAELIENPNVVRIDLDVGGTGSLENSVPLIDADDWHGLGITGSNVVVAVLDSGLDTDHGDLGDDLIHQDCFVDDDGTINGSGLCPNGSDRQSGPGAAEDGAGHGTNVTGIITSRGTISSVGVAPNAEIVAIKVLDDSPPSGVFFFFSEIVAALDHIIIAHS